MIHDVKDFMNRVFHWTIAFELSQIPISQFTATETGLNPILFPLPLPLRTLENHPLALSVGVIFYNLKNTVLPSTFF